VPNLHQLWSSFESWILDLPSQKLNPLIAQLHRFIRIFYALIKDVLNGQISLHAMSLVYTTMLSVVPMLALSFSVLKAFNVQDQFTPMLYAFLEPMGDKGLEIHNQVLGFVDNIDVKVLGVFGFLMLFYTVISLVQKIERAFNSIWYAPQLRSLGERFSHYLSVILVGPVLVVAAISVTASTMSSSVVQTLAEIEPLGSLILLLTKLTPFLMVIAAFSFFYTMMPNTKVNAKSALFGGVIAGTTWQASSLVFTTFMVNSAKYDAIYSGFAVGILLLIWLYMNWLILLLGSSIAFYHQHGNHISRIDPEDAASEMLEKAGLDIMRYVAIQYESKGSPVSQSELEGYHQIPSVLSRKIIDKFLANGLLLLAGEKSDQLVPGRSTDKISVASIFKALRQNEIDKLLPISVSPEVEALVSKMNSELYLGIEHISLRELLQDQ